MQARLTRLAHQLVRLPGCLAAGLHFLLRCRSLPTPACLVGNSELRVSVGELIDYLWERLSPSSGAPLDPTAWYRRFRPSQQLLARFRRQPWPGHAPRFTILLRLADSLDWLEAMLASVAAQTYPHWQLAVVERPTSEQGRLLQAFERQHGPVYWLDDEQDPPGDYFCFLDHGDCLEPHALHRFAETILRDGPDLLYSDAVRTGNDIEQIEAIESRPAFSYEHYLSCAYFSHLLGIRGSLIAQAGGLGPAVAIGQNVDLVLRVLERATRASHVADILYRQRCPSGVRGVPTPAEQADIDAEAVRRHLARLGRRARVLATAEPSCREVRYPVETAGRVAVIIPTRNQASLLSRCLDSLRATLSPQRADIHVVDHESDADDARALLHRLPPAIPVLPFRGSFNFSALMNQAVARLRRRYDYYLFLNNDTEALAPGWLEHMLGLAQRPNVAVVGALLLYPNQRVQHAGVMVGMHYAADHVPKDIPSSSPLGQRLPGPDRSLLTVRDQSAVTGACMLVRADAFAEVGGFDEQFAVGFNDVDLCLRLRARGYQVLLDAYAVLTHHEAATRGRRRFDPHPGDTRRFRARHWRTVVQGDPYYSPLASRCVGNCLRQRIGRRDQLSACTLSICLPQPAAPARREAA